MKDTKLTEQQKQDVELLSRLPAESQNMLISFAAGMLAGQQIQTGAHMIADAHGCTYDTLLRKPEGV